MQRDGQIAMIRLTARAGQVQLDELVRMPGRGGYLHRNAACLVRFERSRVKEFRSLRLKLSFDERRKITELMRPRLAVTTQLE